MTGATDTTPPPVLTHQQVSILRKCDDLRKRGLLCDITLIVEDVRFEAHKVLLAASSDYFSSMFTAQEPMGRSTHTLAGVVAETFASVLDFIYGARVSVEQSSAEQLLELARLLGMTDLVHALSGTDNGEVGMADAEAPNRPKRKRGRPRRVVDVLPTAAAAPDALQPGEASKERRGPQGVIDNPAESDDADYEPQAERSRHSKRKVRPPIKYVGYRVGSTGTREPGRPGRKRKYPETEPRCEDCGKVFKNHMFLKIHLRTHTGSRCLGSSISN